MWNKHLTLSIC